VTHPSSGRAISADVGETPVVVSIGSAEGNLELKEQILVECN